MDLNTWINSSVSVGWLFRAWQSSWAARIIGSVIAAITGTLSGSFFLSWMVSANQFMKTDAYPSSKVIAGWNYIKLFLLKICYVLGDLAHRWMGSSLVFGYQAAFMGFIVFLYMAYDVSTKDSSGAALAVKCLVALVGLAVLWLRPSAAWWQSSLLASLLSWWNADSENQEREALSWLDYATFLVVGYAIVDYTLRMYVPTLAGIWDELMFIALVGLWIVRVGIEKLTTRQSRFVIPFIVFSSIFVGLYLLNALEPQRALEGLRVYIQYVLWFFVGFYLLNNRTHFKWIFDLFIIIAFALALYGVYQYYVGVEIPSVWIDSKIETTLKTRVFSIIGSPNILGSILVLSISMTLAGFLASRNYIKKLVYAGSGAVMLACLVFTFSRGAWIAIALSVVLLGLWLDRRIIWGLILIAFLTPIVMPSVYDRLAYMTTDQYKASSERGGRLGRWSNTLSYWQTSPTAGVGLGQYGGAVAKRYDPEAQYTDNFYLKTGAETGTIGIISLLLLMIIGLRMARRSLDTIDDPLIKAMGLGIFAGLVGIAAHNAVENVFEVPMMATYFWFFMGLLTALGMLKYETGNLEHETD